MKKLLGGLFAALVLACSGGPSWRRVALLDPSLKPAQILPLEDGAALLFGYTGDGYPLSRRRVAAVRVEPDGEQIKADIGGGWIVAAAARGNVVWAVHATARPEGQDGSDYALLVSRDGGRSWESAGAIPARSLTGVAVEGDQTGWVIGVGTLLCTTNAGRTWMAVATPVFARGVAQPIATVRPGHLLLGGVGLYRTGDGGKTWSRLTDGDIPATDGRWVVARGKEFARVGRIKGNTVEWTARIEGAILPDAVWGDANHVLVRAEPLGSEIGHSVLIFESRDGGATFKRHSVPNAFGATTLALGPRGDVWKIDLRRRLYVRDGGSVDDSHPEANHRGTDRGAASAADVAIDAKPSKHEPERRLHGQAQALRRAVRDTHRAIERPRPKEQANQRQGPDETERSPTGRGHRKSR